MVSVIPEGRLVYGLQLPVQAQSDTFCEPWERSAGPSELVAIARQADATGFFYIGVCEHVVVDRRPPTDHMQPGWYDVIATLSYLAAVTSRVRLLSTVVILGLRHPLVTAKQWTTLDRLSEGRTILGVGVGWAASEHAVMGADFARRGELCNDAIDVIRACFRCEYPVVSTTTWSLDGNFGVAPRPVQSPIPIWVGGSGKPALRRVAERGDGWIPQGMLRDEIAAVIAYIEEHRRRVRPEASIDYGFVTETMYVGQPGWDVSDRPTLVGSPAELAERMRVLRDLGINHLQVRFRHRSCDELLDQMEAWGTEVAPLLDP
jgi:probable F420-dependent oxidoreductase